jgi:5'-3' exonuclease
VVIIDASILKHLIIHSNGTKEQILKEAKCFSHHFLNFIISYKIRFNCSKENPLVIAVDRRGNIKNQDGTETRNYWRQKYYNNEILLENEGYKGHRKKDDSTGIDWNTIETIFDSLLDVLDKFTDITVLKCTYLEADDIISICSDYYNKNKNDKNIIAITHDKDMKQIVNEDVKLYNPFTNKYTEIGMTEEEKTLFYLSGDAGDGVPPVKVKTREKSWLKLLKKKTLQQIFEEEPILAERFKINRKIMNLNVNNLPKKLVEIVVNKLNENNFTYKELFLIKELKKFELSQFVESKHLAMDLRFKEFKLEEHGRKNINNNSSKNEFRTQKILNEFKLY